MTSAHAAAKAAAERNSEKRLEDEARPLEFFEGRGSGRPSRTSRRFEQVQNAYLQSEFSVDWPERLLERINAVE